MNSCSSSIVLQVSILHDCRHPHVLLLLGAWLGEDQLFMITELMEIDLWRALACPSMLQDLRWENKCVSADHNVHEQLGPHASHLYASSQLMSDLDSSAGSALPSVSVMVMDMTGF